MSKLSPMMEQYLNIKKQHPDKFVFFQVGDFYEIFFDDAPVVAQELDIALTSRDTGKENPVPLAGVPVHAAESYINKLLSKGYKLAICDQVEEASQARGLVRRAVTRILTPGTITDPEMLEEARNNYLVALQRGPGESFGLAAVDVSTGDFCITECSGEQAWAAIADELFRLQPAECICTSTELCKMVQPLLDRGDKTLLETVEPAVEPALVKKLLVEHFGLESWDSQNLSAYPLAASAAAAALQYLHRLQSPAGKHFHSLELYFPGSYMIIDSITSRNLELTRTIRSGEKEGTLLGLLDRCVTAMGRRLIRRWVERPLLEPKMINERLAAVEEAVKQPLARKELRSMMRHIIDLERFCGRLCCNRVSARDLVNLAGSLEKLEALQEALSVLCSPLYKQIGEQLPPLNEPAALIRKALVDDPPLSLREGGLFKDGYHEELDRLKALSREGRNWLLKFEKQERERTGIKSLRIGYNKNFGYYIEVTRPNLPLVPVHYHRRQTLVNAERFVTAELKEMEDQITGARDRLFHLEYTLFEELRDRVANFSPAIQETAHLLARLDCLLSLAEVAEAYHYCKPEITTGERLYIKQGRHPVVEQIGEERFVPNDILMNREHYLHIITGPNMAGKSTYCRGIALICLMGQIGSFVSAEEAVLPVLDRIFARVGASDDLSRGYSTFMVEMQETATILKDATPQSLLVLDEIGRGTSTYDGMSIARSVLEYISHRIKAKTLFSTHYHELTNLEGELPGVKNYTMAVKEKGKDVIFLRRVVEGRTDKSYGINVARLAGLPVEVIMRAETILAELEMSAARAGEQQLSLLAYASYPPAGSRFQEQIIADLRELDLNRTTPLEALQLLFDLQQRVLKEQEEAEDDHKNSQCENGRTDRRR